VVKFAGRNSENRKVGECFQWWSDNQLSYGQAEATAGFGMVNRSKEPPPQSSDFSVDVWTGGEICWAKFRTSESGRMFSMAERQPAVVWMSGGHSWIWRSE